jgi:hypothetical protein
VPPPPIDSPLSDALLSFVRGRDLVLVTDDGREGWERRYARAIGHLCRLGVRHVVCSESLATFRSTRRQLDDLVLELGLRAPLWTAHKELVEDGAALAALPTLLLIGPDEDEMAAAGSLVTSRALPRPRIAVVPERLQSWERPDMTVREMYPASLRLVDLPGTLVSK